MKRFFFLFFLIVISILLYLFESSFMFSDEIDGGNILSPTIIVFLLLVFSFIAIVLSKQPIMCSKLSRRFSYLMIIVCIISYVYSIFYSLGAQFLYGLILLPLLLFYYSSCTTQDSRKENAMIWSMTIVSIMLSYYFFQNYYKSLNFNTEQQTNGSYPVLYLLPFLLCHKKRLTRIASIVLTLIVVMFSLKRGGFIALIFAVVTYLFISQLSLKKGQFSLKSILVIVLGVVGFYYAIQYLNNEILGDLVFSRIEDIEESEGSGRLEIYKQYLSFISNDSIGYWLLGHGWGGSIRDSGVGLSCHNDFLEAFVDFGVVGFVLYVSLYVSLIQLCVQMVKTKHPYAPAMGASIALLAINSMVSHILIYPRYFSLFALFWGFIVASYRNNNQEMMYYYEDRIANISCSL